MIRDVHVLCGTPHVARAIHGAKNGACSDIMIRSSLELKISAQVAVHADVLDKDF